MIFLDSLNRFRSAGLASPKNLEDFDEVLCLFLILFEVGTSAYVFGIHYDLPFVTAPGVRPNQAERRFVTFETLRQVGTALSADWMRPSR